MSNISDQNRSNLFCFDASQNCTNSSAVFQPIMNISATAKAFIYTAYSIVFILGITGNLFVILSFCIKKKLMRTFDVYIISLAIADLTASFFVPIVTVHDLVTDLAEWQLLGTFGCKLFVSIDHITMLVSAFTLIVISAERMRVIGTTKLVQIRQSQPVTSGICIAVMSWICSIGIVSPFTATLTVVDHQCRYEWSEPTIFAYYAVYCNLSSFVPAVTMLVMYTISHKYLQRHVVPGNNATLELKRRKKFSKLSKMFSIIVVVFFVLTMPSMIVHFIASYYGTFETDVYWKIFGFVQPLQYATFTISHFNCIVNPFVYARMHTNLKATFSRFFRTIKMRTSQQNVRSRIYRNKHALAVSVV